MLLFLCPRHKNKTEQWIFKKTNKKCAAIFVGRGGTVKRVTVFCAAKNGGSEARSDARVTDFFAKQKNRNERNKTKNQSKDVKQLLIGEEEQGSVRMLLFLCPRHKNKTEQWIFKKPTKSAQQFLLEEEEQWSG